MNWLSLLDQDITQELATWLNDLDLARLAQVSRRTRDQTSISRSRDRQYWTSCILTLVHHDTEANFDSIDTEIVYKQLYKTSLREATIYRDDFLLRAAFNAFADEGYLHVIKYLTRNHKRFVDKEPFNQLLVIASKTGNHTVVGRLLELQVYAYILYLECVMYAIREQHVEVIRVFLDHEGLDVSTMSRDDLIQGVKAAKSMAIFGMLCRGISCKDAAKELFRFILSWRSHILTT